jgi:hypothetical protein
MIGMGAFLTVTGGRTRPKEGCDVGSPSARILPFAKARFSGVSFMLCVTLPLG